MPLRPLLITDVLPALALGSLSLWASRALEVPARGEVLGVVIAGTLLVYALDHWRDERLALRGPRGALIAGATVALTAGFVVGGQALVLAALPSGLIGLAYGARGPGGSRIRDLRGAKGWWVAGAVTWAIVALPIATSHGAVPWSRLGLVASFVFGLTALNAHSFDIPDAARDLRAGAPTWVAAMGPARAGRTLVALGASIAALSVPVVWASGAGRWEIPLSLAGMAAGLSLATGREERGAYSAWVDGALFLPLVLATVIGQITR